MPLITVGDLDVAYTISGPEDGLAVLLLHGWPDDASTWDRVVERLTGAGYRSVVPSLRGFGETRFRSNAALRTGDSSVLAMDAIGLMEALGITALVSLVHGDRSWRSGSSSRPARLRSSSLGELGTAELVR